MHFLIAIVTPQELFVSTSSATIRVAARLIPALAIVVAKRYIDIISSKRPEPSLPILFATYTLKNISIALIKIEVTVKITVLNKKSLKRFIPIFILI